MTFRYGSVCSGIEAASVAWEPLGMEPAWFAEIDPFASAVLAHRYPHVPNLGDFTKIGAEHGPIDLLVGGTPCQAFSVAGRRDGLADPRGNLTLEFFAVTDRLRPTWLVWENVPGVLSINEGRTFGTILGIVEELGYGWAYATLDAQHFGVPQRRRRVFLVGHSGGQHNCAAAVLFDRACLSGDPPPSRAAGQGIAGCIGGGAGERGWAADTDRMTFVAHSLRSDGFDASEDGTGRGTPLIAFDYCMQGSERTQIHRRNGYAQLQTRPDAIMTQSDVRRLTPLECERLQGLPDGWTLVPYRGKPAADGPRYRAIGNSMAVPVMRWIGRRILEVAPPGPRRPERDTTEQQETMGVLQGPVLGRPTKFNREVRRRIGEMAV